MNEFIIRSLQNRATDEEANDLRRWRAASAEDERWYRILAELWRVMDAASGVPMPGVGAPAMPDPEILIAKAEAQERDPVLRAWTRHVRTAALAAAIAAVGFGLGWFAEHRSSVGGAMAQSEVKTGAGEMTTVTLADGTSVRLGPRSRLRLAYDAKNRRAWLEGRAFFGVQTDPSRPFTVQTRYGEAVVHGTRFEVRSEDEEFRVLVVDGKVSVSAGGVAAELGEGEMSRSPGGAPPSTSKVEDAFALLDWMGSALVFHRTPLNRAIREIERRYGVPVVLEDPRLGELEVTVTFTDQVLEEVVLVLCEIIGGRCSVEQDRVRISKGPPIGLPPGVPVT